jgi:SnoaL-like domain
MTTPTGLERVIAKDEIRDLCYRYARGSDRLDAECFASAFWDDGAFNQPQNDEPFSKFAEMVVEIMGKHFALTHHLNGNILIDFVDEDHATTEVYFRAFHLTKPDLKPEELQFIVGERCLAALNHVAGNVYDIVVGGRYLDHVERRDGIWKIKLRRLIFEYCTVRHSETLLPGEGMSAQGAAEMARDKSDPSYLK